MEKVVQTNHAPSDKSLAFPRSKEEFLQLKQLKDRILSTNAPLPIEDPFLLKYLRYNKQIKNEPDSTISMMVSHISSLSSFAPLPSDLEDSITTSRVYVPLKYTARNGIQVMVLRIRNWDPSKLSWRQVMSSCFYVDDYVLTRQQTQCNGIVVISDWSGCTWRHLTGLTESASMMKRANAMPMKLKGYHFVHGGSVMNMLLKLVNPFLKPKVRNRIFGHGSDFSKLHSHICPSILPVEYGGQLSQDEAEEQGFASQIMQKNDFYRKLFDRL